MIPAIDRRPPVPAQRWLYLSRRAVVREQDGGWYVVHREHGRRVITVQHQSWPDALTSGLHWVGLA